jgi:hypothetical protein
MRMMMMMMMMIMMRVILCREGCTAFVCNTEVFGGGHEDN